MAFTKTFQRCFQKEAMVARGKFHNCLSEDTVRKPVISKALETKRCKGKIGKLKPENYHKGKHLHRLPSGEQPFLEEFSRFDFIKGDVFSHTVSPTITKLFISAYITRCAANH